MKQYAWDEYYEKFYDWAESTRKQYARSLLNYGDESEVAEIALEFTYDDKTFAKSFIAKAMQAGVRFNPPSVIDLMFDVDQSVLQEMVTNSLEPFTKEDLEDLEGYIDDATYQQAAKRAGVSIEDDCGMLSSMVNAIKEINAMADDISNMPAKNNEVASPRPTFYREEITPPPKRPGFWATLFGATNSDRTRHNGRCNGDCANCPPHYGYRYGRWYYGHSHTRGCEFGGNKGDGGRD